MTLILVWQGAPQNFMANQTVTTIEGTKQDIAMGPIASLVSIKHLGTNGGGFLGANSTTPLENPTIISDITELLSHDDPARRLRDHVRPDGTTTARSCTAS